MSQVHPQYDALSHVGHDECLNRPSLDETMRRRMWRNSVENSRQNLSLKFSQPWFWRFNQSDLTARFWQNTVMIMMQLLRVLPVPEPFKICEPQQLIRRKSEPTSQLFHGLDGRKIPSCGGRHGLHLPRIGKPPLDGNFVSVL